MGYNPFVSVLINNYNYANFLPEAIDSVLSQTYQKFELIIVDDGSTDNSKGVMESYYQKYPDRIITIYKDNGGQASAYNKGFEASKGEIICLLDSDDYWFNNKLERVVEEHKEYAVVQHNLVKNGKELKKLSNMFDCQKLLKECGYFGSFAPSSALSFTRDVLTKVFPIPEEPLRICADAFVRNNAVYFSPIYSIDKCLGVYRIHKENLWQNDEIQNANSEIVSRKSFESIELLNKRLMAQGFFPIPYINKFLQERVLKSTLTINSGSSYILYGTGDGGRRVFEHVKNFGANVAFFSDSNPDKWGEMYLGKRIISPKEIRNVREQIDKIIIASVYLQEICETLMELGFKDEVDIIYPIAGL